MTTRAKKHQHQTSADLLRCVRDILKKRGAWTQGVFARTKTGKLVDPTSQHAASFCLIGAVRRCSYKGQSEFYVREAAEMALDKAVPKHFRDCVPGFNDARNRTKAEVLAVVRKAISIADRPARV